MRMTALLLLLAGLPASADAQCPCSRLVYSPPELLIVAGPPYDLSCAGRDVLIRGDQLAVILRGGCRSVTVEGRYDRIAAELLPGATVTIGGAADLMNFVVVAQGPGPVVRTTLPGLQATLIQRFGESELKMPTSRPGY